MPDKLKHSTRGANQNHNRRSDGKIRPSRRLVPPFRPRNPPHADFSFRPTDFLVQGYRLFDNPYRLFLLRLRGHSDESYGTRFARFPNFCRAASASARAGGFAFPMRIFGIITADDACLSR